ncbi:alkaline phosphatase PhoX [Thalassotalea montiporae]
MVTRRKFCLGLTSLAFAGLSGCNLGKTSSVANQSTQPLSALAKGYGPLQADATNLLDLPAGFSYEIISQLGQPMSDGMAVPDRADGMGCLPLDADRVVLIRNHELSPQNLATQPEPIKLHKSPLAYDQLASGVSLPGGTTSIIYNLKTKQVEREFISLSGTIRNCAGGVTPWGSWLSCEENVSLPDENISQAHGYIFEVPASAKSQIDAKPLKAMGRFNHEAAAVDPKTGIVYLTEDRGDSLFYRFIPKTYGKLAEGGQLQALVVKAQPQFDTRNWQDKTMSLFDWLDVEWINITNPESPEDDLRKQGLTSGAALFARGEGIHWADNELYFCCTNGGNKQLGQIMRYQPSAYEGTVNEHTQPARLQLFLESEDESLFNFGDNLTVTPQGHLLVCEDQYTEVVNNHLRGVTPDGKLYDFARLHAQTELAGACFSPDGSTLFVNLYSPAKTLAIKGPWQDVSALS